MKRYLAAVLMSLLFLSSFSGCSLLTRADAFTPAQAQTSGLIENSLKRGTHEHHWIYITSSPPLKSLKEGESVILFGTYGCVICDYCDENLTDLQLFTEDEIQQHLDEHNVSDNIGTHIEFRSLVKSHDRRLPADCYHLYYRCAICNKIEADIEKTE